MEAADDAPLSYLGFPDKILTYSTLKSWFLQTTPKALVLSSFITILPQALPHLFVEDSYVVFFCWFA